MSKSQLELADVVRRFVGPYKESSLALLYCHRTTGHCRISPRA